MILHCKKCRNGNIFLFFLNLADFYIGGNKKVRNNFFFFFLKCKHLGQRIRKPRNKKKCLKSIKLAFVAAQADFSLNRSESLKKGLHMSCVVRKPDFCICENKDADQLRGNHEADQRLCFRYIDSTIPLLPKSKISSF